MIQRSLEDAEKKCLAKLTDDVTKALEARRAWLDTKMHECSPLQVGDDIYDIRNGVRLGKVSELYRYWRDRDGGIRDTSLQCEYVYQTGPRSYDNTSRQLEVSFGTREDAAQYAQARAARLGRE